MDTEEEVLSEPEKIMRFGCGALLGVFIALLIVFKFMLSNFGLIAAIAVVAIFVCGVLALKYGDEFWREVKNWWY
ncbi:hypothetical protein [Collimonas sp.]|jgi:hypothetical protein|uniref:hypothetical protein n=1 Tax=Collimonas sp. TaxID=1963772 RepID=UPI002BCB5688|nr:hypothetical protein [Collimonas sp.]HWX03479.1 hypothetical protein [Collimonas sp.]